MKQLGHTNDGAIIGLTPEELAARWLQIVQALAGANITPDLLTIGALMIGTEMLARESGIMPMANHRETASQSQSKTIGFMPALDPSKRGN